MAWIIAGGALLGGLLSSSASKSAANTQADAANNAAQLQWSQYQQTRTDLEPWRQAGATALGAIGTLGPQFTHQFGAGDLQSNLAPNYQFQLDQGLGATRNLASAGGGLLSGNTLKGINDYAQNYAGGAYQQAFNNWNAQQTNIFNRLSNIAGLGQTANQTSAATGQAAAGAAGGYLTSGAAAQAAGTVGAANAVNNGIGSYLGWNYLNSRNSPGAGSGNQDFSASAGTGYSGLPSWAIDPYGGP